MIFWEEEAINDRKKIFDYLHDYNPVVASKTDVLIESRVEDLLHYPLMGVQRPHTQGRLLIIPDIAMMVLYQTDGLSIRILRVFHQKLNFPR